jgi:hypothetical protein
MFLRRCRPGSSCRRYLRSRLVAHAVDGDAARGPTKESQSSLGFPFRDCRVHRSVAVGDVEAVVGIAGYGIDIALLKGDEWVSMHEQAGGSNHRSLLRGATDRHPSPGEPLSRLRLEWRRHHFEGPRPRSKKPEALVVTVDPDVVGTIDRQAQWLYFASAAEDCDQRAMSVLREGNTRVVVYSQIAIGIEGHSHRAVRPVPAEAKQKLRTVRARQIGRTWLCQLSLRVPLKSCPPVKVPRGRAEPMCPLLLKRSVCAHSLTNV